MSAVVSAPAGLPLRWVQSLWSLALLLGVVLLLYRDTAATMVGIWYRSETFTHAFLVPPISLWLIWRRRQLLLALQPRPMPWMLAAIAALGLAWLVADMAVVNAATQFALVGMLVLCVPAVLGRQVAQAMMFPLAFLFFCVPFGEFLLPVLMERTADFTVWALRATGIPVYREGLRFVIPSGSWSVVEACSGVRYLIASLMVGSLFAYLNYTTMWRRWVFVGVSIVVPIVANWLRAYMIVMIGHLSNNTLAVGVDHLIYGWIFFGIVIALMFWIGARWAEPEASLDAGAGAAASDAVRGADEGPARLAATVAGAVLLLLLPPLTAAALDARQPTGEPRLAMPASWQGGWVPAATPAADWKPHFLSPTASQTAWLERGADRVGVYLLYYRGGDPDRKLVSSQNLLVDSQDRYWHQVSSGRRSLQLADGQPLSMRHAELLSTLPSAGGRAGRLHAWMVYWIDGRLVAGDVQAKLYGVTGRLAGRGDDGAAVLVVAAGDDAKAADAAAQDFVRANLPLLQQSLQQARASR